MKRVLFLLLIIMVQLTLFAQETTRTYSHPGEQKKPIVDSLSKCIIENPTDALAMALRGEIVFHLNHNYSGQKYIPFTNADALLDIKKAIDIEPENPKFYKILSDYYFYINHSLDSAIITISKSIQLDSLNPAWFSRRGFLNAKAGYSENACEDWKAGSKLEGKEAEYCKNFWERRCKK